MAKAFFTCGMSPPVEDREDFLRQGWEAVLLSLVDGDALLEVDAKRRSSQGLNDA
jgi:hypothetical protein